MRSWAEPYSGCLSTGPELGFCDQRAAGRCDDQWGSPCGWAWGFAWARMLMDRFGDRAMLWAVPLAWMGQEVTRAPKVSARWRFGFLALGYSQSAASPVAQLASSVGVYGLGGLIVIANVALAWLAIRRTQRALMSGLRASECRGPDCGVDQPARAERRRANAAGRLRAGGGLSRRHLSGTG